MKALGKKRVKTEHTSVLSVDELEMKTWKFMYEIPPTEELTLEMFEQYAYDRLKILKNLELYRSKRMLHEEMDRKISEEEKSLLGDLNTSDKDYISHHILRLAFSKTETQRNWLKNMEGNLFELRLKRQTEKDLSIILSNNGIPVTKVESVEKENVKGYIQEALGSLKSDPSSIVYKVDWTHVLTLIATRKAYVQNGFAYISGNHLVALLSQSYRDKIGLVLERINKVWPYLLEEESERLVPFLTKFGNKSVGHDYKVSTTSDGSITAESIDSLLPHFPLCMRHLHTKLRQDHHLKHQGRLQYGLFLKGIGLSLDQAMQFWRDEFTKKMTDGDFDKNYGYNFRHQFGSEGKKTSYSPYGCMKIIMGNAPMGESAHHGCPYKHQEGSTVKREIIDMNPNMTSNQVDEIMDLAKDHHYQIACAKYFESSHPNVKSEGVIIHHPNQYFELSRKLNAQVNL